MESDDDYQLYSPPEEPSSPIHQRKLKRLKKAVRVSNGPIAQPIEPSPSSAVFSSPYDADHEPSKTVDIGKPVDLIPPVSGSEGFNDGRDSGIELDGLIVDRDRSEAQITLDVEEDAHLDTLDAATEEFDEKGEDLSNELGEKVGDLKTEKSGEKGEDLSNKLGEEVGDLKTKKYDEKGEDLSNELGEEVGDLKTEKSAKKRRSSEGGEEKKKNKKKRGKNVGDDGEPEAPVRTKRKLEKERMTYLKQLHTESQRLLRETTDAAFKPVPLVQKPISSVLEKIRQRKLEVSKKAGTINSYAEANDSLREIILDLYPEHVTGEERGDDKHAELVNRDVHLVNVESSHLEVAYVDRSSDTASPFGQHENILSNTDLEESKNAFRTPINDTQDLYCGSQPSEGEDVQPSQDDNPLEEVLAPSLLTMNLKFDSAPPDDISSDEEDDGKENIDPHPYKLVNGDSYPKGDPVKAFVDDEAEEEDDSDNDPMRFQENEEDEENEESEELNDLIVTGYEEKPIDNERRDQLHQKWLEQQDAASTDNVLQRLKCGRKQIEPTMLEEEEDEEFDEESVDEAVDDLLPTNVARINSKKVKQMIPQMFTDKDDIFLSDDDEETEQKIVRQLLLEKSEEHASFLSPAEDESSREVFGLIKKLNIAPDTKKKTKSSSFFDMLITGGNSNSLSKSSFLGRAASNSLPSSHKHGSSNVRSFIFGRDDSNSRSGISTPEVSSDILGEKENRSMRNASAKFSNSQTKCSSQNRITTETSSGSSLLQVLRSSSMQSDHYTRKSMVSPTQAVIQFAALKSARKSIKIEART